MLCLRTLPLNLSLLLALAGAVPLAAQQQDLDKTFAEFQSMAAAYEMADASREPITMLETPIMKWTNSARNNELGSIFLWQREGRPLIVGTVFTYLRSDQNAVGIKHAFHSLAEQPLTATAEGQVVWKPASAGLEWKPLPGTPAPRDRLRQLQMRALARKFEARMIDMRDNVTPLRLLPQPLHTYQSSDPAKAEGAIFALVTGNDPEALLLVESALDNGQRQWRYAFARFHYAKLEATLAGQTVWTAEPEVDQLLNQVGRTQFQERVYSTMLSSIRSLDPAGDQPRP